MKSLLYVILLIGSLYFLTVFIPDARTSGTGDAGILIAWSIRRCVVDIGIYVCFVSIVFGTDYFLNNKKIPESEQASNQNTEGSNQKQN